MPSATAPRTATGKMSNGGGSGSGVAVFLYDGNAHERFEFPPGTGVAFVRTTLAQARGCLPAHVIIMDGGLEVNEASCLQTGLPRGSYTARVSTTATSTVCPSPTPPSACAYSPPATSTCAPMVSVRNAGRCVESGQLITAYESPTSTDGCIVLAWVFGSILVLMLFFWLLWFLLS